MNQKGDIALITGPPPPGCVYIPVDVTSGDSVQEGLRVLRAHDGWHDPISEREE